MAWFPLDFFLLTFAFSWIIWLPTVLDAKHLVKLSFHPGLLILAGLFGPSVSAFIVTGIREGKKGVWLLLKRAVNFRVSFRWIAFIFLFPLIVYGSAHFVLILIGGKVPGEMFWDHKSGYLLIFFLGMFLNGALNEEFGWRGYALDRLQSRYNALVSSLILGIIWSIWHLPMFFSYATGHIYISFWVFMAFVCSIAIIFTFIYNSTGGNLFAAILLHTTVNFFIYQFHLFQTFEGGDQRAFLIAAILQIVAAAVIVRIWKPAQLKSA